MSATVNTTALRTKEIPRTSPSQRRPRVAVTFTGLAARAGLVYSCLVSASLDLPVETVIEVKRPSIR